MIDIEDFEEEEPTKPPLLKTLAFSLAGALGLGVVAAGVVFLWPSGDAVCEPAEFAEAHSKKKTKSYEDIEFVNLEPLVITLGPNAKSEYLKISISIETNHDDAKTLEHLRPIFRDVLNTYLRVVDEGDLVKPAAMTRLRAQILRRLQVVAPDGAVANVLITEFVLN